MKRFNAFFLLAISALLSPAAMAKKDPFTGNWISKQFTNGKEFHLKIQQADHELIGWEGRLPPNTDKLEPDLRGTVKGKEADLDVQHRRGYKAHARLRLQGDKLVWQLLESDNRSNRYFPLASTLLRQDEDVAPSSAQLAPFNKDSNQLLWDLLAQADSFNTGALGEAGSTSPSFSAYKALLKQEPKPDDQSLQILLKGSNAAGRLYAAAIAWEQNHDAGLDAFKSLAADPTNVTYKTGCEVFQTTVQEIARSFVEKGSYMDFPSRKY